jgi:hypothetical protein
LAVPPLADIVSDGGRFQTLGTAGNDIERPMVVAVLTMLMVQSTVDEIVDVIAMRHGFMTTARTMIMPDFVTFVAVFRRTAVRVVIGYLDHVFVGVIAMRMMKMPIMEVIDMVAVTNRDVTATRLVLVRMLGMGKMLVIVQDDSP